MPNFYYSVRNTSKNSTLKCEILNWGFKSIRCNMKSVHFVFQKLLHPSVHRVAIYPYIISDNWLLSSKSIKKKWSSVCYQGSVLTYSSSKKSWPFKSLIQISYPNQLYKSVMQISYANQLYKSVIHTNQLYKSVMQISYTNPLYKSVIQISSTVQISSTNQLYKSVIQISYTNQLYKSVIQISYTN